MKSSIKKIGNDVENKFKEFMRNKGYWVYHAPDKLNGQPFDFICGKDNMIYCFDVKHIEKGDRFYISRIEDNQINSFDMLQYCGCSNTFIACNFEDDDDKFYFFRYTQSILGEVSVKKEDMFEWNMFI